MAWDLMQMNLEKAIRSDLEELRHAWHTEKEERIANEGLFKHQLLALSSGMQEAVSKFEEATSSEALPVSFGKLALRCDGLEKQLAELRDEILQPSCSRVANLTYTDNAAADALPAGWEEVTSRKTGKPYYVNSATGECTFIHPNQTQPATAHDEKNEFEEIQRVTTSCAAGDEGTVEEPAIDVGGNSDLHNSPVGSNHRTMERTQQELESRRKNASTRFQGMDTRTRTCVFRDAVVEKVRHIKLLPLEESIWEVVIVVGLRGITPLESFVAISLLILNVCLQTLVCIIFVSKFTGDATVTAKEWRYNVGHWEKFASSQGRPMVSRMCAEDTSLELSGAQQRIFGDVNAWLIDFGVLPVGVTLVTWCIAIWFLFILQELETTVGRMKSMGAIPRIMGTKVYPVEDGFIMVSFSKPRLYFASACCILRMCVALTLACAGGVWLVHTDSPEDLLLNSVALVFVLDIDEILFLTACPLTIRAVIQGLEPLPCPISGAMGIPTRAVGTIVATCLFVLMFYFAHLREVWDINANVKGDLCGQEREFVTGVNPLTGIVFSYAPPNGNWDSTVPLISRVTSSLVNGQRNDDYLQLPSWTQFKQFVGMDLPSAILAFGKCSDLTSNDGFLSAALQDALGISNSSLTCSGLTTVQCDAPPAIVRLSCPVTCGCNAVVGRYLIHGCPMAHCTVRPGYLHQLEIMRVEDMHREVLQKMPVWEQYWRSYTDMLTTDPSLNIIRWHPPFVRNMFAQYGCDGFQYFANATNSTQDEIRDFFCLPAYGYRRPLSAYCPETCKCSRSTVLQNQAASLQSSSKFCPNPRVSKIIVCEGAQVHGPLTVAKNLCNQSLASLSSPVGKYSCNPYGYNGKHSYQYLDGTGVTWRIRWETASNFDWAALYMGAKAGYAGVSKWTLSSVSGPAPFGSGLDETVARFFAPGNSAWDFLPEHGWLPRNASNTDLQCAGGQLTTHGGGQYGAGDLGGNTCPVNYTSITNILACGNSSFSIGYIWQGEDVDTGYPRGCYGWSGGVYWNPVTTNAADPQSFPICERDTSGG